MAVRPKSKPVVSIEPAKGPKMPYSTHADIPLTFQDELAVTANTVDLLEELGMPVEMTLDEAQQAKKLVQSAISNQKTTPLQQPSVAFAAKEFLKSYANQLAVDVHEARSAITAKLMELANCGDPKYELKALELLGKHSDIGLFTERSEITVNYKSSGDLENAIKERVKRLLNADIIDVTPLSASLEDELRVEEDTLEDPEV